jgi:DeoR family transcriptional regulator, aga operon transcriptional repressor
MNRYERLNTLLELLAERGKVDVDDIAEELTVSAATIRRDLDHLAEQQLVTRTRGGAVAHAVSYDLPLRYKTARHTDDKLRIGKAAAALVDRGAVVGLNGGTTATEVARALAARPDHDLTVVTNALNIATELAVRKHIKLVVTGGVVRPRSYELIGPLARLVPAELTLDVVFIGVDAIDPELGASAHDEGEAAIDRLLASHAGKVVVVTDSSKLSGGAFARICPIEEVDTLVTDTEAEERTVRSFRDHGVEVLLV